MATTRTTKKSTNIIVVESDQIVQHIVPGKTARIRINKISANSGDLRYTPSSQVKEKWQAGSDSSDTDDEGGFFQMETLSPGVQNEDTMSGKEIFQFKQLKKSGQMVLKAQDSCSSSTPKVKQKITIGSPQSTTKSPSRRALAAAVTPNNKKKQPNAGQVTPKRTNGVAALRDHKRVESSTPYRLRKRNLNLENIASSSDDSIDETSEEEEEDKNDEVTQQKSSSTSAREAMDVNMTAKAEAYFDLHSMAPCTSDRTLSALDGPRMDVDSIREILKNVDIGHRRELDTFTEAHVGLFRKWMLNMCCGYNILLHGLGSKRNLLEKFREQHLTKFTHLVVNGYFPSLTVKHILNSITEEVLGNSKGFSNIYSQVEFIQDTYKKLDEDFYLIIHNIDGVLLRSDKSQAILSHLSEIQGFHIIASMDHINAALMWDQNRYFRFHWLWYETPTFLPYEAENGYENSLMVQQSGTLALSSAVHVMRSLTPNARQVFLLLAEYQMLEGESPHYAGMSFQNLYHKCREAFLVNSDLTLQAQLVEFKDHRLIRSKKNYEGVENLVIPLDRTTLKAFLQEYKDGRS